MASKLKNKITGIRERLDDAWNFDRLNREEAEIDLKFRAGDQWPKSVREEREASGRPVLTVDKLGAILNQVINDIKQNAPSIKARPVDDKSDPDLAKVFSGIIRQIEEQSGARYVYSRAADHCISCGIGHFRILTQYMDDSAFDQEILMETIPNPLAVVWDPASIKADKSDAMYCFVIEKMQRKAFEDKYPDAVVTSVGVSFDVDSELVYSSSDEVLISEYWEKVPAKKMLAMFEGGQTLDITDLSQENLFALPPIVMQREVDTFKVQQYLVTGNDILEGPNEWAGKHIPIVSVVGNEFPMGNGIVRTGMIRAARDSQQMYNYMRTAAMEAIAQAPKTPWLVTKDMIKKHKSLWDVANKTPSPYLVYDVDPAAPGAAPKRERPADPPSALWQEGALASDDMKATTGIYDASLGNRSNETSGKAIMARQREGDVANYHFTDNLTRALEHAGRILIDLIPKIYDTQRVVRILGEDDTEEFTHINTTAINVDGEPVIMNDLSTGRFDVKVATGPSYTTKRIEAAESMMQFIQAVPGAGQVAGDLIAKSMDWPGSEVLAERLRKMVPPQLLESEDGQQQQQPQQQTPDPMQQEMQELAKHKIELELAKIESEVLKNKASIAKTESETEGVQIENMAKSNQVQLSMF